MEADQKALDELDRQLLRSVWWLSYHQSTHSSILRHSNTVIRSFLGMLIVAICQSVLRISRLATQREDVLQLPLPCIVRCLPIF